MNAFNKGLGTADKMKFRLFMWACAVGPFLPWGHKLIDRCWHLLTGGCLGH